MIKRGKQRVTIDYYSKDAYKHFKTTSDLVGIYGITQQKWTQINKEINDLVINQLYEGRTLRLPYLGTLSIIKYKINVKLDENGELNLRNYPVNYKKTWELWFSKYPDLSVEEIRKIKDKPLVYEENKHTNGYKHKFKWSRTKSRVKNKTQYGFFTVRKYNRKLNELLKDPNFKGDFYGT